MGNKTIGATPADYFLIRRDDPTTCVQMITDPAHPLYDSRIEQPVSDQFIWTMRTHGQNQPAVGLKQKDKGDDGRDVVILLAGRRRWRAALRIWEDEAAQGISPLDGFRFKLIVRSRLEERECLEIGLVENEHRDHDEPIVKAQKLRHYLDQCGDDEFTRERARMLFRLPSIDQLNALLKLLDLTPKAKEAVAAGKISPTLGAQMSRMRPEDQDKAVQHFSERPRPPSVREGVEVIREMSGKKTLQAATLREIDSEFETHEERYEKAMDRLAELDKNLEKPDHAALREAAANAAREFGWIEALKWCRGETRKSKEDKAKEKAEGKKGKGKKKADDAGKDGAA